jgi:hypothetical protein
MPQHAVIDPSVVIRAARGSDGTALENLARMDSQRPVAGSVLVAEQGGVIVAAIAGDRAIADPVRPTADLVELLRLHAARTSRAGADRSRVRVPRLRAA